MLGPQASLVANLVDSIVTVLDTATKLYSDVKDADDIPEVFCEGARLLAIVQDALRNIQMRTSVTSIDDEAYRELQPILERSIERALRLETVFRRVVPHASISRRDRYLLIANTLGKESRVETLIKGMLEDTKLLAESSAVEPNAEVEIKKLAKAIDGLSTLTLSTLEDALGGSINNYGSGTVNMNTGSGTANNNNGSGRLYVGQNQFFGGGSFKAFDPAKLLADERKRCLSSLSFATIDAWRRNIATAHEDTCEWIFETSQFQQWRDRNDLQSHNGVLWIMGKPGAGKSTLMKHIWKSGSKFFKDYVAVAYFFNARGEKLEKTPLGMLRSMACQLLDHDLLYERFLPHFRDKEERHEKWEWRETELKDFLLSQAKTPQSKPLFVLIDALDECRESDVREVVGFFEEMSICAVRANVALNICLSSRHWPTISMRKSLNLVVEETCEHDDDIARYVHDKLKKQDKDIETKVLRKAGGVFMWVVLVVAILNQAYDEGKVEAMHQKLNELPGDLEKVFENLLHQDDSDKDETICLLQWVLFARRALKPEELYFGMRAGTQSGNLGAWDRSKITSEDIQHRITSSSRGLIEIRKGEDRTVQFIHESVNDFLLRNKRLQTLDSALQSNPIGTSHDRLRACCMSYLNTGGIEASERLLLLKETTLSYPLLEYASTYALQHAEEAQRRGIVQTELLHWLQDSKTFERLRHFHNAFEKVPGLGCSEGARPLYMLSLHGCQELLRAVLYENGLDVNALGGAYDSALQAAASEGENEVAKMLLAHGADVNAQGGLFGSALQAAALESKDKIIKMLLDHGVDVNAQGGVFGSALQIATLKGEDEIVKILLDHGADVNAQGGLFGSALQAAAINGEDEIVKILLAHGADVNAQGGVYSSVLQAAISKGKNEIAKMLLDHGADVNAQSGVFGSALQATISEGKNEIVKMLLDHGADVNAQGGAFGSALQSAVLGNHDNIVGILLEKGADVNAQYAPRSSASDKNTPNTYYASSKSCLDYMLRNLLPLALHLGGTLLVGITLLTGLLVFSYLT